MKEFFRCVAESVAENGVDGLVGMVPGGGFAIAVAGGAWKKYRDRQREARMKAEVEAIAQAGIDDARRVATEVVKDVLPAASAQDRVALEIYLTQIPGAVRASLKRPDDGDGRTVPPRFVLDGPEALISLLPGRAPSLRPGDALAGKPGWSLVELLGVGGFGEVWLARHKTMTALSGAVKFCHRAHSRELLHESTLINRVMEVARGKPPNIVPLTDVHLDGDSPWLMYEYVAGGDLTDVIRVSPKSAKEFRIQQTLAGLRQLCTAVSHFHRLSPAIVHRDLKPSNILVDRTSRKLLVTDFGIGLLAAKSLLQEESRGKTTATGRQTESLRGAYTPLYSSPQQQAGAEPDPRDDVHALGVIAYQWLTGQLTHGAGTDFVHELREIGTPDPLIDLIGHCVAKNPVRRPANAGELLAQVQAIAAGSSPPTAVAPAPRSFSSAPAVPVHVPAPLRNAAPGGSSTTFVVDGARLEWYRAQAQSVPLKSHPFVVDQFAPTKEPEPDPLPEDLSTSSTVQALLLMVAGGGLLLTVLGMYKQFFLFAGPLVAVGFGIAALVVNANSPYRRELTRRKRAYEFARRSLAQGEQRWEEIQSSYEQQHASLGQQIAHGIASCLQLGVQYANDLASIGAGAADAARRQHMKSNTLATAEIPNIGDKLKQVLAANGIVTASDIDARVIATISGFGKDRTQSLLAWRDEVLRAFRFDPSSSIPEPQLQQLADGYQHRQGAICQAIEDHLRKLFGLEAGVEKALSALVPELRELVREWMQARGNLRLIEAE